LTALAAGCAPGPELCHGMPIGAGLRDALALCWTVSTNGWFLIALSVVAALGAFRAWRPLLGTLTLFLLPILSLVVPMLAVLVSRYEDCPVSADGIGSCQLWGASMGMTFHNAEAARDLLFGMVPYIFALTVMLGLLGFFFARPRRAPPPSPHAQMRQFGDDQY
jgi:hypothetical protein